MSKPLELAGKKFNRLTVLRKAEYKKRGHIYWACLCECGNECVVEGSKLKSGHTKSCGCLMVETVVTRSTKHGNARREQGTREYYAWQNMKKRCYDPENVMYVYYGGRGITVCDSWVDSFPAFLTDMGTCPDKYELDRVDNDLGYFKDNCRWVSNSIQGRNRRNVKLTMEIANNIRKDTRKLKDIAASYGISISTAGKIKNNQMWVSE